MLFYSFDKYLYVELFGQNKKNLLYYFGSYPTYALFSP